MGSGISLKDLEYIQKIAGSNKNIERRSLINKMPIWMRPSGTFGIGLHSVFLLLEDNESPYDKIYIETRSLFDGNFYNIEMTSPISSNQGYCFITQSKKNVLAKFGTTLSFYVRIKRRGLQYNAFLKHDPNDTFREIYSIQSTYDPLIKPIHDYLAIMKRMSEIKENVVGNSPVKVSVNELNNTNEIETNQETLTWDSTYSLFFIIGSQSEVDYLPSSNYILRNRFKGQIVDSLNNNFYVPMFIDFYGFSARDALTLDRTEWRENFKFELRTSQYFFNLIKHLLESKLDLIKIQLNNDLILSSLLHMFEINNVSYNDLWTDLKLFSESGTKKSIDMKIDLKFNELLKLGEFTLINSRGYNNGSYINFDAEKTSNTIVTNSFNPNSYWMKNFIENWYINSGLVSKKEQDNDEFYYFEKEATGNNLINLFLQEFIDNNTRACP